jgi:hypothetical protein
VNSALILLYILIDSLVLNSGSAGETSLNITDKQTDRRKTKKPPIVWEASHLKVNFLFFFRLRDHVVKYAAEVFRVFIAGFNNDAILLGQYEVGCRIARRLVV